MMYVLEGAMSMGKGKEKITEFEVPNIQVYLSNRQMKRRNI